MSSNTHGRNVRILGATGILIVAMGFVQPAQACYGCGGPMHGARHFHGGGNAAAVGLAAGLGLALIGEMAAQAHRRQMEEEMLARPRYSGSGVNIHTGERIDVTGYRDRRVIVHRDAQGNVISAETVRKAKGPAPRRVRDPQAPTSSGSSYDPMTGERVDVAYFKDRKVITRTDANGRSVTNVIRR